MAKNQDAGEQIDACKRLSRSEINKQLISQESAADLEDLFKTLANETRLRLLHALSISKEMCVNELSEALEMKPQAVSNQLQKLAGMRVVDSRRRGVNIYYRIINPCVEILLERGICMLESGTEV